jgi:uncharacterized protein YjiS (DUF1127 family)
MLPQIITPTRPYPCDHQRYVTGRELWARLAARIARLLSTAIQEYQARRAIRRLMEFDDRLLRDIGVGRGEIERVVRSGRLP